MTSTVRSESHYGRAWDNPQGVAADENQSLSVGLEKFLPFYKVVMMMISMITMS